MRRRYLLPDDQGVRWESDGREVLFAFKAFPYPLSAGVPVVAMQGAQAMRVETPGGVLHTTPWTAYRIG